MSDSLQRLTSFLQGHGQGTEAECLSADASTREYYRIQWNGRSAIACVYPESFVESEQTYLDVTRLFLAAHLPVANIYAFDGDFGVIVQEDMGDEILRNVMAEVTVEQRSRLRNEAISLIARIQTATELAFETNSIASRLKFDTEKLLWELNFFKEHYFTTYSGRPLSADVDAALSGEFQTLAARLEGSASVLCHRDFHAANLMIDPAGKMRIIDHQDARIGSPAYDLVSLLLDRITDLPSPDWLAQKRRYFLEMRVKLGLPKLDEADFAYEFRLQTLQRCLKAAGTFSYQSAVRGKTYFQPFILPMFRIVHRSAGNIDGFPTLITVLENEIAKLESEDLDQTLK